jgi:hypothetical protein
VDAVDLDATDESLRRVRVRWAVSVRITDVHLLRQHAQHAADRADLAETSFAEVWNRAADPCAPLRVRDEIT